MSVEVTFRTLSGGTFKLSLEPNDTILDVKKKIAAEQNESEHAAYRLIFKGKILDDEATVTSSGVSDAATNFVVVMPPRKARPASKTSTPTKPAAKPPTTEKKETSAEKTTPAKSKDTATAAAAAAAAASKPTGTTSTRAMTDTAPATLDSNSLVTGQDYEESLRRICDMGFPEDQVKRALRAAFNNPDRAVEFLFNGIPEGTIHESTPPAPSAPPANQQTPPANPTSTEATNNQNQSTIPFNMFELPQGDVPSGTGNESNNLDFLRSIPQFNLMRRLIQANPAVLPQILQRLGSINPQLMSIIDANQEEFTRLINEPINENEESEAEVMNQLTQAIASAGGTGPPQPEGNEVYVTEEEHQQINRLTELASNLGIQRAQVLETWLACNRDEQLAANFLVDHAEELVADQSTGDGGTNPNRNEET